MPSIEVIDKSGSKVDTIELSEKVFDGKVNKPLLQQVITMYLANQRIGSANTKMMGEVRGGGRKPWRQKGTGRARVGTRRSPLWRGGGITHGPKPKDWHYQLPKKLKKAALCSSLNAKLNEKNIKVVDDLKLESHKTKELFNILKKLKLSSKKLMILSQGDNTNLKRAVNNIKKVQLARFQDANAYQLIVNDGLLIEKKALEKMDKNLASTASQNKARRQAKVKVE